MNDRQSLPRAAYIHVPFCRHRCGYCNFTLVAGRDDLIGSYLEALARELAGLNSPEDDIGEDGGPHEVETLFFGGGTPTHLPPSDLARLFEVVRAAFPLAKSGELSVEANPIDLCDNKASVLTAAGVTRISLGVQSFDPRTLKVLERDHSPEQIARSFEVASSVARSVSLDLIFGVPGQSLADWRRDLAAALELAPDHVSTYGLTFEKGTSFWSRLSRGELARADEDVERAMYEAAIDTLTAAGYEHYEVSNFARPGHRCRHNETYWTGRPFFAAGPGAARFVGGRREINHKSTTTYIARLQAGRSPVAESEQLAGEDAARERLVFALRRLEGIDLGEFAAETGFTAEQLGGPALARFVEQGLLEVTGSQERRRLKLTRRGLFVSDALWPAFLRR